MLLEYLLSFCLEADDECIVFFLQVSDNDIMNKLEQASAGMVQLQMMQMAI